MSAFFHELIDYFEVGGYLMPPLVLSAIVLWYAIGYRWAVLKRGNRRSVRVLIDRAREGALTECKGIIDSAVVTGLKIARRSPPHLRRYLDDAFSDYERDLKQFRILISAIVAVAPLMGLLGTVVGMIETFESLGEMSLFSQSGGIAGGISQALFTTQMGLAIAIPGLIVRGVLDKKQARIEMELAQIKDVLSAEPNAKST